MKIRKITEEHELQTYQELCKYCFPNWHNWIDNIFPLPQDDIVWGAFQQKQLQSGVIAKSFASYLFKKKVAMSGMSAVVSAPERRNSGHVRQLLKHVLQQEVARGMLVSCLYPFLFQFYEKMGYGYIGGHRMYTFKPEDIRPFAMQGECVPVVSPEQSLALIQAHDCFIQAYDFGIEFQHNAQVYHEKLKASDSYAYIYTRDHETQGYLEYRFMPGEGFSKKMHIGRFGFLDAEAMQALLAFIRSHRNQCCEVTLVVPGSLELRQAFQEPRVKVETISNWMARPLDVEAILRLRLGQYPCEQEISFSLHDPLLEKNTGTYRLHGTEVLKTEHSDTNPLPFPVFSSLLFSAYTFEQVYHAGRVDWFHEEIAAYFSKQGNNYVSAYF